MSNAKHLKSIRQIKERAAVIRQGSKISIPQSLDLASREHGFLSFEDARQSIAAQKAAQIASYSGPDPSRLPDISHLADV